MTGVGSAQELARALATGMPFFDDRGFYKRAQITANDLVLACVAEFADVDRLTVDSISRGSSSRGEHEPAGPAPTIAT